MNAASKTKKGRPPLSPLEKAIRQALNTRRHYRELKNEHREALAIDPGDPPALAAGKRQVADDRYELARQIEKHRRKALATDAPEAEAKIREKEKQCRIELNDLPPLGHSYESWEALPEEERKGPVGKPPLPLDVKLCRAEIEWQEAMKVLEAEAKKAGVGPIDLDDYRDPVVHSKGIGRPGQTELGEMDTEIRRLQRWIRDVEALPDSAFKAPKGQKNKPIPREKRIARYEERIAKLREEIERREAQMTPVEKLRRKRKLLLDERRPLLKAKKKNAGKIEELTQAITELDRKIQDIGG